MSSPGHFVLALVYILNVKLFIVDKSLHSNDNIPSFAVLPNKSFITFWSLSNTLIAKLEVTLVIFRGINKFIVSKR